MKPCSGRVSSRAVRGVSEAVHHVRMMQPPATPPAPPPPTGPPPWPPARAGRDAPRSGWRGWALAVVVVLVGAAVVGGVLFAGGGDGDGDPDRADVGASDPTDLSEQVDAATEEATRVAQAQATLECLSDVLIPTMPEVSQPGLVNVSARGQVTNATGEAQGYTIEVEWLDPATGPVTATAYIDRLAPGESSEWATNEIPVEPPVPSCTVTSVDQYAV